ncbi:MAG: ester cyclase [Dehalococcoidia bacterium]
MLGASLQPDIIRAAKGDCLSTARENGIKLLQKSIEAENRRDYVGMFSVFTPVVTVMFNGQPFGSGTRSEAAKNEAAWEQILADLHRELQWVDATDDRVVAQYRLRARHVGEFFGFAPTGNWIDVHGALVCEHDGEHISVQHVFADQGEMNRQLSGRSREPGDASAAPIDISVSESERSRYEAIGERLARQVYEGEAAKELDRWVGAYADPFLDYGYGHARSMSGEFMRSATKAVWKATPSVRREVEEVINTGNRTTLRWHLTADGPDGNPISQHGCTVFEHDGELITRSWAYYPDIVKVFPAIGDM